MSKEIIYRLEGLTCANCANQFESNLKQIPTVKDAKVNFAASKVAVQGEVTVEQIEKAGAFDGIKVVDHEQERTDQKQTIFKKRENVTALIAFAILLIGLAMMYYLGEQHPLVVAMFILSIVVGGYDLFKSGLKNLFQFYFDMKTLMTIAIIGAAFIGEWIEGAIVVLLFALSEALESYSIDKARQSITSLIDVAPKRATIKRETETVKLDVKDIQIGDVMVIKPGEKIAMDGVVISGQTSVNQAAITGESLPVFKSVGDEVFAGTINEDGAIEVRVTKLVDDTTIAKIIHLVEEAQVEKAPAQQFVDRFAKYYTPAIMLIALLVAIVPPLLFAADWSTWVYLGLATLVVGCPCALIISTPVAIVTAIGTAARNGVLIKGGVHLEETGRLQAIAFDKTGTLTKGKPEVTEVIPLSTFSEEEILKIAATIEKWSQHPVASAIIHEANHRSLALYDAENFTSITGKGVKASVDGKMYYIGNVALVERTHSISDQLTIQLKNLQERGNTVTLLANEEEILGMIAVKDPIRESSRPVIEQLQRMNKRTYMFTGDNVHTAKVIANEIGITDVRADLLPEEKLFALKEIKNKYHQVAMVGDGVNDAPALANASVGIAMGGAGTDAALETADIVFMDDDLRKLPYTISLSRKALNIIKQNISFSLILKVFALMLVIPGWLTLWIAILADVGATVLVVLNAMRLMNFQYE